MSLFDHPGCSTKIDVNTATVSALCQIFAGSGKKRKQLAEETMQLRKKEKIMHSYDLVAFISTLDGALDHSASARICF
jgi:16S rRNA C1402 N4-methylase RsmH